MVAKSSERRKKGFVYKERSFETLKQRAERKGGRFDSPWKSNFDVFKPKEGENLIRFLPPTWDDASHYGLTVFLHKYIGIDNSNYLCLRKMLGKRCPICEATKEAENAGEVDEAKAMATQESILTWILDRDDDKPNPILYPLSWTQDRDITALCVKKRSGQVLLIDHPYEGFDVSFIRTGVGVRTRYSAWQVDRDPSPIAEDDKTTEKILEFITDNPLPDVLHYQTADYLEKVISGGATEKDEDLDEVEEEEEAPKARSRRRELDPEDEEEEDEKPTRRRRAAVDEEEEEDEAPPRRRRRAEPEEDEEEEEEPRRRRRAESEDEEEDEPPARKQRRRVVDEEEEEDEDPKPRRRRAAVDEEEEEEPPFDPEDEEEEEESRRPVRRRARA